MASTSDLPDDDSDLLGLNEETIKRDLSQRDQLVKDQILIDANTPTSIRPIVNSDLKDKTFAELSPAEEVEIDTKLAEYIAAQTREVRINKLLFIDPIEGESRNRALIKHMPIVVFATGTIAFAPNYTSHFKHEFIEKHKSTAWPSVMDARRKMIDYTMVHSLKYAARRGIRLSFLATTTFATHSLIEAYVGKTTFWEFSVSAGLAGALYFFNRGAKAMFVGSLLGGIPGLLLGSLVYYVRGSTGSTYEDLVRSKARDTLIKQKQIEKHLFNETISENAQLQT